MAFDVNGALQAGASEDDVLNHLSESRKFDVQGALKAGASKRDVIDHMAGMNPASEPFADYKPMSAKDKLVSAGKQLGSAIISPITGIPGALREVATFASDPNAWSKKHFDASSANEGPGEMGSNPLVDAEGNAMLAVATGRGRGTDAMGLPRGKTPAPIKARMGIPDEVPPPAEPPASASGGQSLPRRILDASRAARKTFKDVKEAPERFIDSMAGKAVDLYDGKVDAPKPPAPPPVPVGALKPPPEPPAPAPQPDAIQARRAAHAATRVAIMDRMAPPEPPAATSTPEPPQYERGKIARGLPPPKAPAPPAGADYVMPEPANAPAANVSEPEGFTGPGPRMPAPDIRPKPPIMRGAGGRMENPFESPPAPPVAEPVGPDHLMPEPAPPEPAGRPNVGEPRLNAPPVLPPPTFPQPEAPPATAPPVKPPPVKPEVPPAEPSAALGAFGIEDAKTISKARARQLATDAGIADVDQFKMLRDEGYKIQDDPFGSGETQRNRRGKVTSPEPMKPEAKPAAGETKPAEAETSELLADESGKPVTVYKGMQVKNWRTGEPHTEINSANGPWAGFFTSEKPVAERFAAAQERAVKGFDKETGKNPEWPSRVVSANLRMKNPFVLDAKGAPAKNFQFDDTVFERQPTHAGLRAAIEDPQYDGVIIKNTGDEGTVYVPKKPHQIVELPEPTAAETEAVIRKQKMTELGNALGLSETPAAKPAKAKGKPRAALEDPLGIRERDANG